MLKRTLARLAAVQTLYAYRVGEADATAPLAEYIATIQEEAGGIAERADTALRDRLIEGVEQEADALDAQITLQLQDGWTLERMDMLLRVLLQLGGYELQRESATPTGVIISEYTDIAEAFYDDKQVGFVNAVLQKLATALRGGGTE